MKKYDVYLIESETGRFSMIWSGIFNAEKPEDLFEMYIKQFSNEDKRSERSLENGEVENSFSIYDSFWGKTIAVFEPRSERK